MGGSGGGYYDGSASSKSPSIETTISAIEATGVATYLSDLLKSFNERDVEAIKTHIDTVLQSLSKEVDSSLNTLLGGSVAKNTYVSGVSDVDSLVFLNSSHLQSKTPSEVLEYFKGIITDRLPQTNVTAGKMAITINFSDGCSLQLLPAISTTNGFKIPNQNDNSWSKINPKAFTDELTSANQACGRKVIPLIKLAKGVIANLPEKQKITGYHSEALAVDIFKNYTGELRYSTMLQHYFSQASKLTRTPIIDKAGQSYYVDEYLGSANSAKRKVIADAFDRLSRKMLNSKSIEDWKECFE